MSKVKDKKCAVRACKNIFKPRSTMQKVCSMGCAIEYDKNRKAKEEKDTKRRWNIEKKQRKEALMTLGDWKKRLQQIFNEFIRLRDKGQPCISCGRNTGCKVNAGHYLSVGARPELRFNEQNVHLQCEACNCYKSGNQAEYRGGIVNKIGLDKVEDLEGPHDLPHWRIDDIKEMIVEYRTKVKELKRCL